MTRLDSKERLFKATIIGLRVLLTAFAGALIWYGANLAGSSNGLIGGYGIALLLTGIVIGGRGLQPAKSTSSGEVFGLVFLICLAALLLLLGVAESLLWHLG